MTHLRSLPTLPIGTTLAEAVEAEPRAFTYSELCAIATERRARSAIARGDVVKLLPDAYVAAKHRETFAARADAALLWAGPNAAVAGAAALFLWGLVDAAPRALEVMLPHRTHMHSPSWMRITRRVRMPETTRVVGLTVLPPADAVVCGYGRLSPGQRADALYRAVRSGLVSVDAIAETVARTPRVPSRRELTERLSAAREGAESFLEEHALRSVFSGLDFAGFARQHRVRTGGGIYRLDMYHEATRTAVELDGARFHQGEVARLRDIRRDSDLARLGIQTVRLSFRDLVDRPEWCREVVQDVVRARASAQAAVSDPLRGGTPQKRR